MSPTRAETRGGTSADSAPGSESGELDWSPQAECDSSTPCASVIISSSCGTRHNQAGERVQAAAGRGRAHHVGGDNEGYHLVHVEGHVELEQHAGDLSGARRIHCLPHARGAGIPV
eukprot:scaffold17877_cov66-Phaeocystis_antarctica.AAC.9